MSAAPGQPFLLLVLFAFFVSLVFAVLAKDDAREQVRLGAMMFAGFIAVGVVLGWLMYPFPLLGPDDRRLKAHGTAADSGSRLSCRSINDFVTDRLQAARAGRARRGRCGAADITIVRVPGAFEIPLAAQHAAESGATTRSSASVASSAARHRTSSSSRRPWPHGLTAAAGATGVPMTFGVLTTNSVEEAMARAGEGPDNKGREAAVAAIEMAGHRRIRAADGDRDVSSSARAGGMRVVKKDPAPPRPRSGVQILYQWEIGGGDVDRRPRRFSTCNGPTQVRRPRRLRAFATGAGARHGRGGSTRSTRSLRTPRNGGAPSGWPVLDRLILRMAVCELLRDRGTPPAVVINEALELARTFSTEESVKFINGMLDAIRKKLETQ